MKQQTCYQKNIMIVDDDPDIANDLQELFEKHGLQVTTADNGRNCLLELEKGFQGIIILDLKIPILDCVETIKKMIMMDSSTKIPSLCSPQNAFKEKNSTKSIPIFMI